MSKIPSPFFNTYATPTNNSLHIQDMFDVNFFTKYFSIFDGDGRFVAYSVSRDVYVNTENMRGDCDDAPLQQTKSDIITWLSILNYEYLRDTVIFKIKDGIPDTSLPALDGKELYDAEFMNYVTVTVND
jgi:hypothetical protein